METGEKFEKRLTLQVAAQIIKRISANLYRSPAGAIKELTSNSFDAGADKVTVRFYLNYDIQGMLYFKRIKIIDNGDGMDLEKLVHILTHIGGSDKENLAQSGNYKVKYGRPLIGRLGIGMLSVAASCSEFIVRTKNMGSTREFIASISLDFFNREIAFESLDRAEIGNVLITSRSVVDREFESYTEVEISKFTPPFMQTINEELADSFLYSHPHLGPIEKDEDYFISFLDSVVEAEKFPNLQNFDRLILQLGLMAPVVYLKEGPVRKKYTVEGVEHEIPGTKNENYDNLKRQLEDFHFDLRVEIYREGQTDDVLFSGFKLYKPLLFPTNADIRDFGTDLAPYLNFVGPINANFRNEEGEMVETSLRAYAYHQQKRIKPHEFRGLLFRVAGVAIGSMFEDLTRTYSESPVLLHQMAIEIYLDEGFQTIVNLDRESLYEGAMSYWHLQNFLNNWLNGEEPPKPEVRESLSPENKGVVEIQKEFHDVEKKLFPANEKPLLYTLRKRAVDRRAEKKKNQNPRNEVEERIKSEFKAKTIQYKLTDQPWDAEVTVTPDRMLVAKIPRFEGPRRDLWRTLTLAVLAYAPENQKRRRDLLEVLYETYLKYEGKE